MNEWDSVSSVVKKPQASEWDSVSSLAAPQQSSMQDQAFRSIYADTNPDSNLAARLTALGANATATLPGVKEFGSATAAGLGYGEGESFGARYENLQNAQAAMRQAGEETQPGPTAVAKVAGTILGLGLGGKLVSKVIPGSTQARMAAYAADKPYRAAALANGAIGSVYGAANGDDIGSRLAGAGVNGLLSSAISLPITYGMKAAAPLAARAASSGLGQKIGGLFSKAAPITGDVTRGTGVLGDEVAIPTINGKPDIFAPFKTDTVLGDSAAVQSVITKDPLIPKFSSVPTSDELRSAGGSVYKSIQDSGHQSSPEFAANYFTRITGKPPSSPAELVAAKTDPVRAFVNEWQSVSGKPMTPADVQLMDESLSSKIDQFSTPFGKLLKDGQKLYEAQTALREMAAMEGGTFSMTPVARKAWADSYKLADIERMVEKAEYAQQPTQAIQTALGQLIKNKNRFKAYSPTEQAAIKKAAKIGNAHDLMKTLGSRLLTVGATTAGGAMGGIPGAVVGALASHAGSSLAREASGAVQLGKLNDLSKMIGAPYMMPPPSAPPPYLGNLIGAGAANANWGMDR